MSKPYTRQYIPIKDILNPTHNEKNSFCIYLAQIIQDRFDLSLSLGLGRQHKFDGTL